MTFYSSVLAQTAIDRGNTVLVVCGSGHDAEILAAAGFIDVTISNVDDYADYGFKWLHLDAESLALADNTFDWCVVHAGLHHCASPHRALTEMYRVARKGVLVIEARDSLLMRIAVWLRLTHEFEFDAVISQGYAAGGWRNSAVPNFVYRWTEREVRKTIESAAPALVNKLRFFYGIAIPERTPRWLRPLIRAVAALLPRQGNSFAFLVEKHGLKPWMRDADHMHQFKS